MSRASQNVSDPVLFRKVFLHEGTRFARNVNENVCGRLCDPEDQISHYVRHLGIALTEEDAPILSEKVLLSVIDSVKELRDFSLVLCS